MHQLVNKSLILRVSFERAGAQIALSLWYRLDLSKSSFFSRMICILLSVTITPGSLRIRSTCLYLLSIRIKLSRLCLDPSTSIVPHVLVCTLWNVYSQYTTHAKQLQCSVQHYIRNFKALTILVSPRAPLVYCVLNCLHSHRGYVPTKPFKTAISIARFDKTKKPTWH